MPFVLWALFLSVSEIVLSSFSVVIFLFCISYHCLRTECKPRPPSTSISLSTLYKDVQHVCLYPSWLLSNTLHSVINLAVSATKHITLKGPVSVVSCVRVRWLRGAHHVTYCSICSISWIYNLFQGIRLTVWTFTLTVLRFTLLILFSKTFKVKLSKVTLLQFQRPCR